MIRVLDEERSLAFYNALGFQERRRSRVGKDTATMLAEAGLSREQVPPEYGGTMQDFDPAWFVTRAAS